MKHPIFLTDRSRSVILEAIEGVPTAALPDTCKPFEILEPNTTDGASEKHLPQIKQDGCHVTVEVGSIHHPMGEDHSITWVCLETRNGCMLRTPLSPACPPVAHFTLESGDSPKAAYALCSLHGFWKTEIES